MVECLFPLLGRFDTNSKRFLHFVLADVLIERLRSKNILLTPLFVRGAIGYEPFHHSATLSICAPASVDTSGEAATPLGQAEPHCRNQEDIFYIPGSSQGNSAPFFSVGIASVGHHLCPQRHTLHESRVAVFADFRGLGDAGRRIPIRARSTGHPNTFRLRDLLCDTPKWE